MLVALFLFFFSYNQKPIVTSQHLTHLLLDLFFGERRIGTSKDARRV